MQFKIFNISCFGDSEREESLNSFLRSNRIVSVDKQLVNVNEEAYWCFCVRWVKQKAFVKNSIKIDYAQALSKEEFIRFEKMKVIRKEMASNLGIPAYAVFTNKELSEISKLVELNENNLLSLEGIGKGKMEKIGYQFIKMYNEKSQ